MFVVFRFICIFTTVITTKANIMISVTIFNKNYKVSERVKRMLDTVKSDNDGVAFVYQLGIMNKEIINA